jgi:hypothetical protein
LVVERMLDLGHAAAQYPRGGTICTSLIES